MLLDRFMNSNPACCILLLSCINFLPSKTREAQQVLERQWHLERLERQWRLEVQEAQGVQEDQGVQQAQGLQQQWSSASWQIHH